MLDIKISYLRNNATKLAKYLSAFCVISLIISAYGIYNAPLDYLQGIYAKIMYVHIPSAWLAMLLYITIGASSIFYLSQRNLTWFLLAKSAALPGAMYAFITLTTGSIWGYPTWGTWWVWDARLTSMLLLFFIYMGYLALANTSLDSHKNAKISSIFAVFGLINIPIIKFSVNIWNTLHQGASIFKYSGPSIHSSMLWPLIFTTLFFLSFTCIIIIFRILSETNSQKVNRLHIYQRK